MVGCFGDGSKPILHMDLSCPAIEHIHGETSNDGTIRPNSWGFPMGLWKCVSRTPSGSNIAWTEHSYCSYKYGSLLQFDGLLNIVISYRNVGLPEGTPHLSQWIPTYKYIYICIYVYMYICIYVCVYMYICIYVYMYIYIHHWISSFWKVPLISHQMNAWISTTDPANFGFRIEEVDGIKLYPTHAWKDDMDPILEASGKMEEPRFFSPNRTENSWDIFDEQVVFSRFWRGKNTICEDFHDFPGFSMMRYHSVWLWAEADQIEESA